MNIDWYNLRPWAELHSFKKLTLIENLLGNGIP